MPDLHEPPQWAVITLCSMLIAAGLFIRHHQRNNNQHIPKSDLAIRAMGLFFVILGPLGFFVLAYKPIRGALNQEPRIAVPLVAALFAAVFVYLGAVMLTTGAWFHRMRAKGQHRRIESVGRTLLIGGAVFCVAVEVSFFALLWSWGYR